MLPIFFLHINIDIISLSYNLHNNNGIYHLGHFVFTPLNTEQFPPDKFPSCILLFLDHVTVLQNNLNIINSKYCENKKVKKKKNIQPCKYKIDINKAYM